jgi:hypothetical protein
MFTFIGKKKAEGHRRRQRTEPRRHLCIKVMEDKKKRKMRAVRSVNSYKEARGYVS